MRQPRGYTLIELIIAGGLAVVAIGAAMAMLTQQNIVFTRQKGVSSAIVQSELASDFLERAVRMAGTGIDPQMAFDFDFYKCALPGGTMSFTDSASCSTATRDSATAPDSLVVAYRDPAYATNAPADARSGCSAGNASTFVGKVWGVTAASNSSVTVVLKPGDTIYRGQVLQVACNDGYTYAYATVSSARSTVASNSTSCSTATLSVYTSGIDSHDPFNQPSALGGACFSSGGAKSARAYAVRRNRFFVRRDTSNTANPHSYLMLDQGLDLNDDGQLSDDDLQPVAADILDLQVAYVTEQPGIMALATPPTGWSKNTFVVDKDTNGIWGDTPGTAEQLTEPVYGGAGNVPTAQFSAADSTLYANTPQNCTGFAGLAFYQYPCVFGTTPVETSKNNNIHGYRWTAWPGNIAQVQIGIIAQAPTADDPTRQTTDEKNLSALLNRSALTSPSYNAWYAPLNPSGRKRVQVLTGVRPVNMSAASLYWN